MDTKATKYGYNWAAYKAIEEDMLRVAEYIPLETRQYEVYSFKLADIILRNCSHIDSLLKDAIRNQDLSDHPNQNKITQYRSIAQKSKSGMLKITAYIEIFSDYWNLAPIEVTIRRNNDVKRPFEKFNNLKLDDKIPTWWQAHNKLKHDFYSEIEEGTLENALLSLSALFILNCKMPLHFKLADNINYLVTNGIITSPNLINNVDLLNFIKGDSDFEKCSLLAKTNLFEYWLKYDKDNINVVVIGEQRTVKSLSMPTFHITNTL
jgi:hypothetical protein